MSKNLEDLINEILNDSPKKDESTQAEEISPTVAIGSMSQLDKDGTVAVKEGKLLVNMPNGTGKYPSIFPGENVKILLDGMEVKGALPITEDTRFEIVLDDEEAASSFDVTISSDELEAYICLSQKSGKKYRLADQAESPSLVLHTELIEEISPRPVTIEQIQNQLFSMGITYGIDYNAMIEAEGQKLGQKILIAQGKKPVPPQNGFIEYLFGKAERVHKEVAEKERVDYLDKGMYESVEIGTVLAILHPPKPGQPGITVRGQETSVSDPVEAEIHTGTGVSLINNDTKAMAVAAGRPVCSGKSKTIKVLPQLIIPGDVDVNTGHIEFKGDVFIQGNVTEGLMVKSGGNITVTGSVFSGHMMASDNIEIYENLIGGAVVAGGEAAFIARMVPIMSQLNQSLNSVLSAIDYLKKNPMFDTKDLNVKGDGSLLKLLIDIKFKDIPKLIQLFNQHVQSLMYPPRAEIIECIDALNIKLTGSGLLNIKSLEELREVLERIEAVRRLEEEVSGSAANLSVKYAQNALIDATGFVTVSGPGCYHTQIYSGKGVHIKGVCRGGFVRANGNIYISQIGSHTAVSTIVEVNEDSKIVADQVFPNTVLRVGREFCKIRFYTQQVRCFRDEHKGLVMNKLN